MTCPNCHAEHAAQLLGNLGSIHYARCRFCGTVHEVAPAGDFDLAETVFADSPFDHRPLTVEETGRPFRYDPRTRP